MEFGEKASRRFSRRLLPPCWLRKPRPSEAFPVRLAFRVKWKKFTDGCIFLLLHICDPTKSQPKEESEERVRFTERSRKFTGSPYILEQCASRIQFHFLLSGHPPYKRYAGWQNTEWQHVSQGEDRGARLGQHAKVSKCENA